MNNNTLPRSLVLHPLFFSFLFDSGKQFGVTDFVNSNSYEDKPISQVSFLLLSLIFDAPKFIKPTTDLPSSLFLFYGWIIKEDYRFRFMK